MSLATIPCILYLAPRCLLFGRYMVRSPYFLYPDESTVKGSTAAAAALLDACLAKEVRGWVLSL